MRGFPLAASGFILVLIGLGVAAPAVGREQQGQAQQQEQEQAPPEEVLGQPPSKTRRAGYLVNIIYDERIALPLNFDSVNKLIHSAAVAGKAAPMALGVPGDQLDKYAKVGFFPLTPEETPEPLKDNPYPKDPGRPFRPVEKYLLGKLTVELHDSADIKPAALELLNATWFFLNKSLNRSTYRHLDHIRARLREAREEQQQAQQRLVELLTLGRTLSAQAGRTDLSRNAVLAEIGERESRKRDLEMDLAALQAAEKALTEQLSGSDAFAAEMAKLVVERAKIEARMEFLDARLEEVKAKKLLELADAYEQQVNAPMQEVRRDIENISRRVVELRERLRSIRRSEVNVLGEWPPKKMG